MALYLRLLSFLRPYLGRLLLAMFFMALVAGANGLTAYVVKPVLDKIFFEKNEEMILLIPLGIVLLYLSKGVFDYLQAYLMGYVGQRVVTDIRNLLFQSLQRQSLSYFDRTPTGVNISKIMNDVSLIQNAVCDSFTAILRDSLTIVGLIFVVFYRDWKLALIAFAVLPFATYPIVEFGRRLRRIGLKTQRKVASLTSFLQEVIAGQRIVKAFSMEGYEEGRFRRENEELFRIMLRRTKVRALSSPIMELIGGIAVAVIVFYGGKEVIGGRSTPGNFFSFTAALVMLYEPIKRLNKENHNVQQGLAAAQRVFEIIDREPEVKQKERAAELTNVKGAIEFRRVSFRYEERMILKEIDLRIEEKEVVAIVGASGVGKTTLVNLILRFYDVTEGAILIDGIDIREVTLSSLRRNIGLVTQEVILFNDTVARNIAYGERPDLKRVEEAARMAYAHGFIMRLKDGYDTVIGERGVRLSGGEKQRIAIARALYKDAPILILDEATSSLDSASETEVQKAIENLMKGRTTIIIAHRLSTVLTANRIIVLEGGRIVAMGSHAELLEGNAIYRRLYESQFRVPEDRVIRLKRR
jgi:subfamily B ATP-binding cassette protein MsbA